MIELTVDSQSLLLQFLLATYPLYVDRASRSAAQDCLRTIVSEAEAKDYWETVIKFLQDEASKNALAPSSIFVLVEWCSALLQVTATRAELWQEWGLNLVQLQAKLFELCCGNGSRESRIHTAIIVTRRGIRAVAKSAELKEVAIQEMITMLTTKGTASTAGNAPLLGVIAGVCDRLSSMRGCLAGQASAYYTFYTREIVGSRTIVPMHIAGGLHDFFCSSVITQAAVEQELVPAIEKALLRAPEVVLNDLLTPLIKSLPIYVDLSEALKDRLLKSLLANTKSTNPTIRDGAVKGFRALATKTSNEQVTTAIAEELLRNLKDSKAADQRTLVAQLLSSLSSFEATVLKILPGVVTLASKEANEIALSNELDFVTSHLIFALKRDVPLDPSIAKAVVIGLGDKKPSIRRIWAAQCGELAWNLELEELRKPSVAQIFEPFVEKMIPSWEEVLNNPLSAAQNGLVTIAHVLSAIHASRLQPMGSAKIAASLQKANISTGILGTEAKPSFLTNHRIYTKLTTSEEMLWAIRALGTASIEFANKNLPHTFGTSWAQAVIFMISSTSVPPTIRQEANKILQEIWRAQPSDVSSFIVDGMWLWLKSVDLEEKDSPATSGKTDSDKLHLVLNALCSASPVSTVETQVSKIDTTDMSNHLRKLLIKLVVLCRKPLLSQVRWIDLCLQCGLDPRTVVMEDPQAFIDEVTIRASVR